MKKKIKTEVQELSQEQFGSLLKKCADDFRTSHLSEPEKSPLQYLADKLGVNLSALNSYYFTQYSNFQKDLKEKINPYISFTISIIHALNLGFEIGKLERKNGTKATNTGNPGKSAIK